MKKEKQFNFIAHTCEKMPTKKSCESERKECHLYVFELIRTSNLIFRTFSLNRNLRSDRSGRSCTHSEFFWTSSRSLVWEWLRNSDRRKREGKEWVWVWAELETSGARKRQTMRAPVGEHMGSQALRVEGSSVNGGLWWGLEVKVG